MHFLEVRKNFKEMYLTFRLFPGRPVGRNLLRPQRWTVYAVLPEGNGKGKVR